MSRLIVNRLTEDRALERYERLVFEPYVQVVLAFNLHVSSKIRVLHAGRDSNRICFNRLAYASLLLHYSCSVRRHLFFSSFFFIHTTKRDRTASLDR